MVEADERSISMFSPFMKTKRREPTDENEKPEHSMLLDEMSQRLLPPAGEFHIDDDDVSRIDLDDRIKIIEGVTSKFDNKEAISLE